MSNRGLQEVTKYYSANIARVMKLGWMTWAGCATHAGREMRVENCV
jgi:hypothetical protein